MGALAALARGYRRYRLRLRGARPARGSPLLLSLKLPDGRRRVLEVVNFPLLLNETSGDLWAAPLSAAPGLLFETRQGVITCTAVPGPALLDGVARSSMRLREQSCLRLGAVRIRVTALPVPSSGSARPPRPRFLGWLAPLALLLGFFFLPGGAAGKADAPAAGPAPPEAGPAAPAAAAVRRLKPPGQAGPGEIPAGYSADILCFHAHPDDEILDFGVLLARAVTEGLNPLVVLFTDGGGGNDAYPARGSGGIYPPRELYGFELAALRVAESGRALSRLGVDQVVRLGLRNHPYNSGPQALSVAATVAAWGGEETLARRLQALLAAFRPRLVAAPAGPGTAAEHFEHQAVGYLVDRAVRAWTYGDRTVTTALLTALDPGAAGEGGPWVAIPAQDAPAEGGASYRTRQLLALSEYRSQHDAAVMGAARLPAFGAELYRLEHVSAGGEATVLRLAGTEGRDRAPQ
jgi:LmbE family N-acetylglucosaminyl deacetylase